MPTMKSEAPGGNVNVGVHDLATGSIAAIAVGSFSGNIAYIVYGGSNEIRVACMFHVKP